MVFKCYLCEKYKFWNKSCYEVIVTSNDGSNELFKRKVCQPCGEQVDVNYFEGKKIAELEVKEIDDN